MNSPLRTVLVEDSEDDALLLVRELRKNGFDVVFERVDTAPALDEVLRKQKWDLVVSDYVMPHFSGPDALKLVQAFDPDLPFIMVSGKVVEETAVDVMKAGAHDFISKNNLVRLAPAINREIQQSTTRRERRMYEEKLRLNAERYQSMIDTIPDGFWLLDEQGRILDANEAYCRMTGYSREELLTRSISDLETRESPEETARHLRDIVAQGAANFETHHRTKNGGIVDVDVSVSYIAGQKQFVAFMRDITERKRAAELLRLLNETLENRVKEEVAKSREKDHILIQQSRLAAMGEMVQNIAHQWRQPLNALSIILTNIQDDHAFHELTTETLEKEVRHAKLLLQRMSTTIDDFRDFFQPGTGFDSFDMGQAVEDALFVMEASLKNNNIVVEKSLPSGTVAHGNSNQFAQAVLNILANAKEAIQQRSVPDGQIEIRLASVDSKGVLTIEDNGGGISPEILPKIFDPYFTTKDRGTGIGLYMSKMIMEKMDGGIEVRNADKGVQVALTLPRMAGA